MLAQQHHGLAKVRIAETRCCDEENAFAEREIHMQILLRLPILRKREP
jgi:hypothetical protein